MGEIADNNMNTGPWTPVHVHPPICAQEIADLRAKLEQGCEVCGHVKGKQQTGPRNPWQIKCEKAEARARRLEEALRSMIDIHDSECSYGIHCTQIEDYRAALAPEKGDPNDPTR